jgi:hypothetical protein
MEYSLRALAYFRNNSVRRRARTRSAALSPPPGQRTRAFLFNTYLEQHFPSGVSNPVNQMDGNLERYLRSLLAENPRALVVLAGDHGRRYGEKGIAGYEAEAVNPLLVFLVPTWMLRAAPGLEARLHINEHRWLTFFDLHRTLKALAHFPRMTEATGNWHPDSIDIFSQEVPRSRHCANSGIPISSCLCGTSWKLVSFDPGLHGPMIDALLERANRDTKALMAAGSPTTCLVLTRKQVCLPIVRRACRVCSGS